MTLPLSRRRLLAAIPAIPLIALAACARPQNRVVNVRDHGAVGDGAANDAAAIRAAAAAVEPGGTLLFPAGSYLFAELNPSEGAAIRFDGRSDVTVEFESGAELVMDTVDPATDLGTSHGILVRGPASNIRLRNVRIRWTTRATRSMGDGIRIVGCPTDNDETPVGWDGPPAPITGVEITDCDIRSAAQSGVILIGVSDITVRRLRVHDTAADGLHFNACRRVTVDDYVAGDNGDDGLALVTYFNEEFFFDAPAETFAFPTLTDWSNADVTATNVRVTGGMANGVRIAGAQRVSLNGITVTGKQSGSGVIVDSATVESDPIWHYVASREIKLNDIAAQDCSIGIHLLARPPATAVDPRFTDFDVEVTDARSSGCTNWGVRVESLTEQRITGLRLTGCQVEATATEGGDGGVGLGNTRDIVLDDLTVTHAVPVTTFFAGDSANLQIGALQLAIDGSGAPDGQPPAPCAVFEDCDGTVAQMSVRWPAAPDSWTPVLVRSADAVCGAPTLDPTVRIADLTVEPASVTTRIGDC
ncbi:hypothetical protein CRI77_22020 [Mycolicibacterium duvalii]|uniref:Pectate lyase superfamily protein domain-containing protein n=1 Tax=Mycolicibacterium duvalii TaxID=39688 RepID=A0A7I7K2Z9_9MYCO|nr:right-handed parallel beta-helix repeat-containing protein [Mycolicibacterium duvalii]MCV7370642.1 right-handed parallel beta-helix repeat-containing protein [Mycolicibacterium duvalii]PEG36846.1 hypothetical protein CRI77_22020 [Mycolicibacterium duvalii]BBX17974.1 hypothetical protein MDUV_28340 [Mycolicibacterium duvalii]